MQYEIGIDSDRLQVTETMRRGDNAKTVNGRKKSKTRTMVKHVALRQCSVQENLYVTYVGVNDIDVTRSKSMET